MVIRGLGRAGVRFSLALASLCVLLVACAPSSSNPSRGESSEAGPGQLTIAIAGEPRTLVPTVGGAGGDPSAHLFEVLSQSLVTRDPMGTALPRVARMLPSVAEGSWRLLPDGAMETTWELRDDVSWHDGQPFTASDVIFSWRLFNHPAVPVVSRRVAHLIDSVDVIDPHRVTLHWSMPYAFANQLSAFDLTVLPAHLLEPSLELAPQQIAGHPYWQASFVGLGPYRLVHWYAGSSLELDAVQGYFLGPARADHISVRFVTDDNSAMASALSGTVDIVLPRRASLGIVRAVQAQWGGGQGGKLVTLRADSWIFLAAQFAKPEPTDLADVRVRRALAMAIDRPSIADAIAGDAGLAAEVWVPPTDPQYQAAVSGVRQSGFDPNAAQELLAQAGWRREGSDNGLVKHGQRFPLDITTPAEWHPTAAIVMDYWRHLGVDSKESVVSLGSVFDRQSRATYSGAELMAGPPGLSLLDGRMRSTSAPAADNFFAGANRGHYTNLDVDRLLDRIWGTLDPMERDRSVGDLNQLVASDLPITGLFFYPAMMLVGAGIRGVQAPEAIAPTGSVLVSWNAHNWERV